MGANRPIIQRRASPRGLGPVRADRTWPKGWPWPEETPRQRRRKAKRRKGRVN